MGGSARSTHLEGELPGEPIRQPSDHDLENLPQANLKAPCVGSASPQCFFSD